MVEITRRGPWGCPGARIGLQFEVRGALSCYLGSGRIFVRKPRAKADARGTSGPCARRSRIAEIRFLLRGTELAGVAVDDTGGIVRGQRRGHSGAEGFRAG